MPRPYLPSSFDTLVVQDPCKLVFYVYADSYFWTTWPRTHWGWDSDGTVLDFTFPEEAADLSVYKWSMTLSGISESMLQDMLTWKTEDIKDGGIDIWFINSDDDDPHEDASWPVAHGYLDSVEVIESSDSPVIELTFTSSLVDLDRPIEGRYTDECQKSLKSEVQSPFGQSFSGDKGFEFVDALQDWNGTWGRRKRRKNKKRDGRGRA